VQPARRGLDPPQEHGRRVRGHPGGVLRRHLLGALAEHVAELHKGDRVLVHGSTYDEEWTDREGATRVKHVIQVTAVGASLRYATATVHRANTKNGPVDEPAALA
jgi:single-stranded DNA-binding protein